MDFSLSSLGGNNDLFLELVPKELISKKTGKNILFLTDFNIAGVFTLLVKFINEKTIHKARLVQMYQDYILHPGDVFYNEENIFLIKSLIANADFFHFGRGLMPIPGINWNNILKKNNCVFQYFGSELRNNRKQIYDWHKKSELFAIARPDYTILEKIPFFYHIDNMVDETLISPIDDNLFNQEKVLIAHAPTNREIKSTDFFLDTINKLKKDGFNIEEVLIEHKPYEECLKIKRDCLFNFDQILLAGYGLAGIEAMMMGQILFCGVANFLHSYYPDVPLVNVDFDTLYERIKYCLENRDKLKNFSDRAKAWAHNTHDSSKVLPKYIWLYDTIMNDFRISDGFFI